MPGIQIGRCSSEDAPSGSGAGPSLAGRRCGVAVGVEIDPRYMAATIARWEAFAGEAAVPLEPGEATECLTVPPAGR